MSSIIPSAHANMCSTVADDSLQRITPDIGDSCKADSHKILQITNCSWLLLKDFFFQVPLLKNKNGRTVVTICDKIQ